MCEYVSRKLALLRLALGDIYSNFFYGPQRKGRPKLPLVGFGLFSIYSAHQCFMAGKLLTVWPWHFPSWTPWAMALSGFSLWAVLLPAVIYIIDNSRPNKRTYRIGGELRETTDKDGYPKISIDE